MHDELRILGTRALLRDGTPTNTRLLAQPKRLAVLAYLTIGKASGRDWVSRDELLALFWPETEPSKARKALSQTFWVIRNELGEEIIQKRGKGDVGISLTSDVERFLGACEVDDDETALSLYRGELLAGFHVSGAPGFQMWLDSARERVRRAAITAAWSLASAAEDSATARAYASRVLEIAEVHDEGELRRVMSFLADHGDRAGALRAYEARVEMLAEEGDSPVPATVELAAEIQGPAREVSLRRRRRSHRKKEEGANKVSDKRLLLRGWLPAGTFGLFAFLVAGWLGGQGAPAEEGGERLVITPFEYRGDPESAYLQDALVDLLAMRLDGLAELRAVDPGAVFTALESSSISADLVEEFAADLRLSGSISGVGSAVVIRATLEDRVGTAMAEASVTAESAGEILEALDRLVLELLGDRLESQGQPLASSAAFNTRSVEALRAFLRGEAAFRRFDFAAAGDLYEEAIRNDSTFALAYFRLSRVGDWAGQPTAMTRGLEGAARHRDRLTPSTAQLLDGYTAFWQGSIQEGLEELGRLVGERPFDGEARFQLADAEFHGYPRLGRSILDSRENFEVALELNPGDRRAMLHLLGLVMYAGEVEVANQLAEALGPGDALWEFRRLALSRDLVPAVPDQTLVDALERIPISTLPGAVLSAADFREDPDLLEVAGRRAYELSPTPAVRLEGLRLRVLGAVSAGRPLEALTLSRAFSEFDPAEELRVEMYLRALPAGPPTGTADIPEDLMGDFEATLLAAHALVRIGELERAAALIDELTEAAGTSQERLRVSVARAALLGHDNPTDGLRILDELRPDGGRLGDYGTGTVIPHMLERFLRATLLERAGKPREALTWYETVAAPVSHTLPFAAPARLRRARILSSLDRTEEAQEELRRASAIWRACSPTACRLLVQAKAQLDGGA